MECDIIVCRVWAMPNAETFKIKPIAELLRRYIKSTDIVIDPFANGSKIATITNNLNPDYDTDYHVDALDFLKMFADASVDVVLYDPPYSPRQVSECYKGVGREVTFIDTSGAWRRKHLDEIQRILKPGGMVFCFGWNSNGVGKKRGFKMIELLLVAHGGSHNDTICTVEVKTN